MTETAQLFLAVGMMILAAKACGYAALRLNQPAVLGELIAGVLLGPTILDMLGSISIFSSGDQVQYAITEFAEIGVILLMFSAGMEVDLNGLYAVRRPAFLSGVGSVILLLVAIIPLASLFDYSLDKALFIGLILASMSTSISAQVMLELGVLQRREGLTLLGASLVDDVLVIILVSLYLGINPNVVTLPVWVILLQITGFLIFGSLFVWFVVPRLANWITNLPISEAEVMLAVVLALLLAVVAEYLGGLATITGAFMAGIGFGRARRSIVDQVRRGLHTINYSFLIPLFFISIGLQANLRLIGSEILPFALLLLVVAVSGKSGGAWGGAWLGGSDLLGGLRVGMGMVCRGEVSLIIANVGIRNGIIPTEIFSVVVLIVLVTTIITPPLIRWSYSEHAVRLFTPKALEG